MKNKLFFFILLLFFAHSGFAQRDIEDVDEPTFRDRVYFGGGGTFQLDSRIFVIGASPIVGYMVTPKFSSGLGVTYQYANYKPLDQSTHTYGGRIFSRYNVFRSVYTMAEYETLNMELPRLREEIPRLWVDRLLIGGGYFQRFPGNRGGINMGIFYDVFFSYHGSGPYTSPWVYRFGFTF